MFKKSELQENQKPQRKAAQHVFKKAETRTRTCPVVESLFISLYRTPDHTFRIHRISDVCRASGWPWPTWPSRVQATPLSDLIYRLQNTRDWVVRKAKKVLREPCVGWRCSAQRLAARDGLGGCMMRAHYTCKKLYTDHRCCMLHARCLRVWRCEPVDPFEGWEEA
jgi:hypothetical protein